MTKIRVTATFVQLIERVYIVDVPKASEEAMKAAAESTVMNRPIQAQLIDTASYDSTLEQLTSVVLWPLRDTDL